ncbi:Aste57867_16406 [Aphanomyces stellatus]|uniref:Aste57867_16406 protein n=1 Tax=Aphanomyces stellatus TaxID=120398 RepID=A0A485L798_9STRA|nr:hypothetical protein As57867_016349 [Aphanomyces stellatus]VFT93181.1 Aste57867_16406 [Aphanomyces stellatus]
MKPSTLSVFGLVAAVTAVADHHRCHFFNNKDSCLNSKEEKPCLWCSSSAVPSTCYDEDEASQLPPGVFECARKTAAVPPENHGCHFYNTESSCIHGEEGGKPCFWCKSAAVPSTCYNATEAQQLPPAVFQCDKESKALVFDVGVSNLAKMDKSVPTSDPINHGCHFFNARDSCVKGAEGGHPCYWCKSAAVPSMCYNETEATQLPPAVFSCEKESAWDVVESNADDDEINWAITEMPSDETLTWLFRVWQWKHKVFYASNAEHDERLATFRANARRVATHNQHQLSYTLELNAFADTTWADFKRFYLGATPQNCSATHTTRLDVAQEDVPEAQDWRRWGAVSPVKDQGKCGSCWTFSTTGCLESHNLLTHGKKILLSEQNLIDCAQAFDNHGCNGGLPSHAFEFVKYNGGLDTGAAYPYHAKDEACKFSADHVGVHVVDIINITAHDENQLRAVVGTVGPVSIAFQVAEDFSLYKEGVYDSTVCKSGEQDVNHAVLAVGYNTTEDGHKYWIVKNSWSSNWGMEGFFNIARDKNMCGLADCASYPIV